MTVQTRLNDPEFLTHLRRAFKSASMIGLGMIVSLAAYLAIVELVRARLSPFLGFLSGSMPPGTRPILRYAFFGAAVLCVAIVRLVNSRMMRKAAASGDPAAATGILFRTNAVVLCLSEIPAILGLVLFLLAGYNRDFYVLLFVSLVLFFMYFPRLKNWEDTLQNHPPTCPR